MSRTVKSRMCVGIGDAACRIVRWRSLSRRGKLCAAPDRPGCPTRIEQPIRGGAELAPAWGVALRASQPLVQHVDRVVDLAADLRAVGGFEVVADLHLHCGAH